MSVRLTSAARVHAITEGMAAHLIQLAQGGQQCDAGFVVDFHEGRAYIWKAGELLADATL